MGVQGWRRGLVNFLYIYIYIYIFLKFSRRFKCLLTTENHSSTSFCINSFRREEKEKRSNKVLPMEGKRHKKETQETEDKLALLQFCFGQVLTRK